ncbi:hypothetical protein MUB24_03520 [Lederbergia sp. NSJ-179]|uniref:hypothetical protein n=1 Tax=Lederbergia sp. NSJ-179 TaxID=2931402 RepID=UPI001FD5E576|nr:hypothetical protein [Lederbergia sp. NSJ-179]MCJ7839997.1 hypothetical protein [Lederbergia sp. NSJ-179]
MKYNSNLEKRLKDLDRDITWGPRRQQQVRQRLINKMNEDRDNSTSWFKRRFIPAFSALMFVTIVTTLALNMITRQVSMDNTPNGNGDIQPLIVEDKDKKEPANNPDDSTAQDNQDSAAEKDKDNSQDNENTQKQPDASDEQKEPEGSDSNDTDHSDGSQERFLTQEEIMNVVKGQMETDLDIKLPTEVPLKDGYRLTATTNSNATNAEIIFYQHTKPIPINNEQLYRNDNPAKVVGRVSIKEYNTQEEADEAIAYENFSKLGGKSIDLGYGMTGYQDGAAGSLHTSWNVGRWALSVKSSTEHSENNVSLAKTVVRYLTEEALPIPHANGYAHLDADQNDTRIMWQRYKTVYMIDQTDDVMTALNMAVHFE